MSSTPNGDLGRPAARGAATRSIPQPVHSVERTNSFDQRLEAMVGAQRVDSLAESHRRTSNLLRTATADLHQDKIRQYATASDKGYSYKFLDGTPEFTPRNLARSRSCFIARV